MEVGRHSAIGAGELYMETEDPLIAQNMHTTIIKWVQAFWPILYVQWFFLMSLNMKFIVAQCHQIEIVKKSDQWPEIVHHRPMKRPSRFLYYNGIKVMWPAKRSTFHHRTEAMLLSVSFSIQFVSILKFVKNNTQFQIKEHKHTFWHHICFFPLHFQFLLLFCFPHSPIKC